MQSPYPIDMLANAWVLGIANPQSIKRLGHFLTADCKSAGTPNGGRAYPAQQMPNGGRAYPAQQIRHHVQLCDTATHKIFYDKLEFIYVEIAKFNKTLGELETLYEKWLYALKNLDKLTQRPKELCDKVFDRLFEEAEIAKFTPQEMREYETSKMAYRDIKNSVDTAKREGIEIGMAKGMEKGRAEGKHEANTETAQRLLAMGLSAEQVAKATQLSLEIIKNLSNS